MCVWCVSSSSSYLRDIVMTVRSKQIQAACAVQQAALVGAAGAERVKDLPKQIHLLRVRQQWIVPLLIILLELGVRLGRGPRDGSDAQRLQNRVAQTTKHMLRILIFFLGFLGSDSHPSQVSSVSPLSCSSLGALCLCTGRRGRDWHEAT